MSVIFHHNATCTFIRHMDSMNPNINLVYKVNMSRFTITSRQFHLVST
jgi:hypothetical protein